MATEYEPMPGYLYHGGKRFMCPCGCNEFKVEIGTDPPRFWCDCGAMYTEYLVGAMSLEHQEVSDSGV